MIEKKIKSVHGEVFYWITENWDNNKDTIFFLHGLTADHTMFQKQVLHFAKHYNLILWDAPAHGKSRPYADFSYPNAVEDMKNLLEENGIQKVIMVGQSLGGYFVQAFLCRYPKLVQAFIGIDTTPYGEEYYSKFDKWCLRQVEWMAHLYPYNMMKKAMAKQVSVTKYAYENMLSMMEQYNKKELCHLMGIGYAAFLEDNKNIHMNCPVLILLGEQDKTGKVKQYCRMWSEKTGFPLQIVEEAAHNANVDNPADVNNAIEQFLKTI